MDLVIISINAFMFFLYSIHYRKYIEHYLYVFKPCGSVSYKMLISITVWEFNKLMEVSPTGYYNLHSNLSLLLKASFCISINSTAVGFHVHLTKCEDLCFCRGFSAELLYSRQVTPSTLKDIAN